MVEHEAEVFNEDTEMLSYDKQNLIFPIGEYQERLDKVRASMLKQGLDALIITIPENIFYLTGYQTLGYWYFQALVIPIDSEQFMVLRDLENPNVVGRTYLDKSYTYMDNEAPLEIFKQAIETNGLDKKNVGVEYDSYFLRNNELNEIKQRLPNMKIKDASGTVEEFRKIKSELELKNMEKAGSFTKFGMELALEAACVGNTENQIAAAFFKGAIEAGSHYMAMPPFVASGPRSYLPHATFQNRTVEPMEFILLEGTGSYVRYHAPCMRTIYTGEPLEWYKDVEKILQDALTTTLDAMKPGITACEVDQINQSMIQINSFGGQQTSRTGYSVGTAFAPDWGEGHMISLIKDNKEVLRENMVFHVLSYIQIPASEYSSESRFGITDTVAVTPQGGKSLINLPYEICFAG